LLIIVQEDSMPEETEPPRPHGDKLKGAVGKERNDPDDNQAQVQSDAYPDATGEGGREESDRDGGRGSTANGVPAFDEDDGVRRRRQYEDGAEFVSRID
jgi:hypothetical protein